MLAQPGGIWMWHQVPRDCLSWRYLHGIGRGGLQADKRVWVQLWHKSQWLCPVMQQDTVLGMFCTSQVCMRLPVSRGEVAFVSAICDFVTLGKSLHPSELQISSVNQAAILNLPTWGTDHLEFELILIWELCSDIARIELYVADGHLHFLAFILKLSIELPVLSLSLTPSVLCVSPMDYSQVNWLVYIPAWPRQAWWVSTVWPAMRTARVVTCPKANGEQLAHWFQAESDKPTFTGKARSLL